MQQRGQGPLFEGGHVRIDSCGVSLKAAPSLLFPTFRIGGESLAVAQNTYAVSWFKGKELNLVFGLQLSMARIVSMVMVAT